MSMSRIATVAAAVLLVLGLAAGHAARAVEGALEPIKRSWPHEGLFGAYDRSAAQRGLQVYREVCSVCHSLDYIAFHNLTALGFSADEVRSLASEYTIIDGPDDEGEMFERPGELTDRFPPPYPNEQAARAANGGALPPDLSLITKARADGSDYLYSLLLGYVEPPAGEEGPEGMYYNLYFPGHWIAMPPPLSEGQVAYADGTEAILEQMSADVTTFLTWAAEPTLEGRKETGLKVMLFLIVLTGLLYATKRKVWAQLYRPA
jgi:ubiquinol-cytochrome c reductase cytochrome c1 subunit